MRHVLLSCGLVTLLLAGCNADFLSVFNRKGDSPPPGSSNLTAQMLVDYLNKNSERLKTLNCADVRMVASKQFPGLIQFQLEGKLAAQQPRDFRLMATCKTQDAVDLGSNANEFWYWLNDLSGSPTYQFFCAYKDFNEGHISPKIPLPPFQPEWVMETLGMSDFGPASRYQLVQAGDTIKLVENTKTPRGQPVQKIIVFNRKPATIPTPQVVSFSIYDVSAKKELCSAQIQKAQHARVSATELATLPETLVLNWPEQNMKLTLRLVNPVANQPVAAAFVRQNVPGRPNINIATGTMESQPVGIQQAGGFMKK